VAQGIGNIIMYYKYFILIYYILYHEYTNENFFCRSSAYVNENVIHIIFVIFEEVLEIINIMSKKYKI
jgi:hypothetical protein